MVWTKDGRRISCKWFLPATGTSFKQYLPDFKGKDKFKGEIHHPSLWPEQGIDMTNKRVAVIGAGSSGIQICQEAAKVASHLTQYIRTPNLTLPMGQHEITKEIMEEKREHAAEMYAYLRKTKTGLPMEGPGKGTFEATPEEREAHWEDSWSKGKHRNT